MARDPRFPPVELLSPLEAVDAPQFLPGSPHNLPARRDQLPRRVFQSGVGPMDPFAPGSVPGEILSGAPPSSGPLAQDEQITIYDPHHYANIVEGNVIPTVASVRFLEVSANRRNLLGFRNLTVTATVRISFGRDAGAFSFLQIAPGGTVLFDTVVPQDDCYCQLSAADATAGLAFMYSTIAS